MVEKKRTFRRWCSIAWMPRAVAAWVFPVPGPCAAMPPRPSRSRHQRVRFNAQVKPQPAAIMVFAGANVALHENRSQRLVSPTDRSVCHFSFPQNFPQRAQDAGGYWRKLQHNESQKTQQNKVPSGSCRTAAEGVLAEEVGFEPTERFHAQRFSRPSQSTTLPLLRRVPHKAGKSILKGVRDRLSGIARAARRGRTELAVN